MSLDLGAAALVLFSAVLHATWNALTKASGDRVVTMAGVMGTCALIGGVASLFVPAPEPAALPYLAVSCLFHFAYQQFLLGAYRHGDLSLVYPIARGLAPMLIALLAATFAGEVPRPVQAGGIALASAAMASFAFEPREPHAGVARSVASAFACAAMIGYGIVLWAMSRGAMANVAALRETSVVFAALIGTQLLGEGFGPRRIGAALCVALGVLLLQTG